MSLAETISSLTDIRSLAAYFDRIGAVERSLRTAVVRETHGRYSRDVAVIRIAADGLIEAPTEYAPTEAEANAIKVECSTVKWPQLKLVTRLVDLPDAIKQADPKDLFEFRNPEGQLIMLQLRIQRQNGDRAYVPYTYYDDATWRRMEPEGLLPLWGIDQLKDNTAVFIHEGAKAARAMRLMIGAETKDQKDKLKSHPWAEDLGAAAHVGWIGGALAPARTDWSVLNRAGIGRAYIVSDNDAPGMSAVSAIAERLRMPTFHVQFTNEWPTGFDLADEFPAAMFKEIEGKNYYTGPAFRNCVHPATWATDLVPNPSGRPSSVLRKHFCDLWAYIEEADLFICKEMPEIMRAETVLNKMLSGFSHSPFTSRLILKEYRGRAVKLCYRPDHPGRLITNKSTASINLHVGTTVKSAAGDPTPFFDFMTYMFPNKVECHEMLRWCATLVAKPEIRMEYGVLLVSEAQGVGKTTLGSAILTPLVGDNNVSFPSEGAIVNSEFNDWLGNKRLAIVNEVYSGHSWKAYNKLKSAITDTDVTVNQKYMRPYTTENWCHFFACSNSREALKIENEDRRWFYPEVTEQPWPKERFGKLRSWLDGGGLQIVRHWAEGFKDWVPPGQRAPMTTRKMELIEASLSEAQRAVADLARALVERTDPVALTLTAVQDWVRSELRGRTFYDNASDLRKAMKGAGAVPIEGQRKIRGRLERVIANPALIAELERADSAGARNEIIRSHVRVASDVLEHTL